MTRNKKQELLKLLQEFEAYVDEGADSDDGLDLEIMKVCMRVPAGYEDLVEPGDLPS